MCPFAGPARRAAPPLTGRRGGFFGQGRAKQGRRFRAVGRPRPLCARPAIEPLGLPRALHETPLISKRVQCDVCVSLLPAASASRWRAEAAAMPGAAASAAGRDWLLAPAFVDHAADMLGALELAALAMTARSHLRASGDIVGAALARRHGLRVAHGTVADLHVLDFCPPRSGITVVKTGWHGRPFQLRGPVDERSAGDNLTPFFNEVLEPGTVIDLTLEANLRVQHGVPPTVNAGYSGSIVTFRQPCMT